jgi:hypothetical protein
MPLAWSIATMMKQKPFLACLLLTTGLLAATPVWSQIYKCVDTSGHPTFSNVPVDKNAKNCKRLQIELDTPPSTPVRATRTPGAAANPTPVGFPRVTSDDQKARDNDRRAILNQELASAQQALDTAKSALAEQEKVRLGNEKNAQKREDRLKPYREEVARNERNIEAIRRELNLK